MCRALRAEVIVLTPREDWAPLLAAEYAIALPTTAGAFLYLNFFTPTAAFTTVHIALTVVATIRPDQHLQ
jgi:uncharacterized membrane protein YphA (DoxX/SURF4 family)